MTRRSIQPSSPISGQKLHFKVNAQIKDVLGRDLINNDMIAIMELVKNSLDAKAKEITISFLDILLPQEGKQDASTTRSPEIIISDDGIGMDADDLENKWLNIAYSAKHDSGDDISLAGSKGVGRFSCDRLGRALDLFTRRKGGQALHMSIDWTLFENAARDFGIQDVSVQVEEIQDQELKSLGIDLGKHGTILHIQGLRSGWDRKRLLELKHNLEKLTNPMAFIRENLAISPANSRIFLDCPELATDDMELEELKGNNVDCVNGDIRNLVFEKLSFKTSLIETTVDDDGLHITTTLTHRGQRLFTMIEKNPYPRLRNTSIIIYYLNPYQKAYFKRETGMRSVDYGSIFLYLNGYRVPPLGDRGNDWLRLDNRKAQGTRRFFGCRDIVGRIDIKDREGIWRVISSREGIVQDEAYSQLINKDDGLFLRVLKKLECYVVNGLDWDSSPENVSTIERKVLKAPLWRDVEEVYNRTEESKEKHLFSMLMDIITSGSSSEGIELVEFDPAFLELLKKEEEEQLEKFLAGIKGIPAQIDGRPMLDAVKGLKNHLARSKAALQKEHSLRLKAEEETRHIQKTLEKTQLEKEEAAAKTKQMETENLFLRTLQSRDTDNLTNMMHSILINTSTIENHVLAILEDLEYDKNHNARVVNMRPEELHKKMAGIKLGVQKISRLASFATNRNYRMSVEKQKLDIVSFIRHYVEKEIPDVFEKNPMVNIKIQEGAQRVMPFSPLEVAIILDNIVINSRKAQATAVEINASMLPDGSISLQFNDNGKGFAGEPGQMERIFAKGFTLTSGSGLGLFHVRQIVEKMGGTIKVTRWKPGFQLEVIFP